MLNAITKKPLLLAALMCASFPFRVSAQLYALKDAPPQNPSHLKTILFERVDSTMTIAQEEHAHLLSPMAFEAGLRKYREAARRFDRGDNLAAINADLHAAILGFQHASKTALLAKVALASAWQARAEAQSAEAQSYATSTWLKAEEALARAARTLEDGDLNHARKKAPAVEKHYRQAEREARQRHSQSAEANGHSALIQKQRPDLAALRHSAQDTNERIGALQRKMATLEEALANVNPTPATNSHTSTEPRTSSLETRESFEYSRRTVTQQEGTTAKQEGDLVLRLYGLKFSARDGRFSVQPAALFNEVREKIASFPANTITITAHGCASSSFEARNRSRERTEAVKQYLREKWGLYGYTIIALGCSEGSTSPAHEAGDGQSEQEHIDIVLQFKR
ncbi:hypothetical protein HUU05_11300 [candidate division KSB1 bacterium]|nr:hypothetical protein [candidate division KSB1 bacterium]